MTVLKTKLRENARQRFSAAYFQAFVVALLICLSPFKALAYLAPFICAAWLLVRARHPIIRRRAFYLLLGIVVLFGFYLWIDPQFILIGGILAVITYGTFVFLVLCPPAFLANETLLNRMTQLVIPVLLLESIVGITQAVAAAYQSGSFDLSNGDYVQGTINPSLTASLAFSNPMFAANICFMLLALAPAFVLRKQSVYLPIALGCVAFVLASVVHLVFFLAGACTLALIVFRPPVPPIARRRLITVAALVLILVVTALSSNLQTLFGHIDLYESGKSPRAQMIDRALGEMPKEYPAMPFVGLGPGQFSSRAALISTGLYFGGITDPRRLPFLKDQMSVPFTDNLVDLWILSEDENQGSTIRPFFSWMSIYTEFGALAFASVFLYFWILLRRMKKKAHSGHAKWLATATAAGLIFFLLMGFQENYWEIPQAILVGLMLLQVMYANVIYLDHGSSKPVVG